jgi:SpoIID/LytB domain protein
VSLGMWWEWRMWRERRLDTTGGPRETLAPVTTGSGAGATAPVDVRSPRRGRIGTLRRGLTVAAAALVIPATLALPVVDFASIVPGDREPVTPTVSSMALAEIDPDGLADSPPPALEIPIAGDPNGDALHTHRDVTIDLQPAAVTARTATADFGLMGITADEPFDPDTRIVVRIREPEGWSNWAELPVSEHRPDPGTDEGQRARYATEPLVTTGADGVQVRIDTPDGTVPADAKITLIDNPVTADDQLMGTRSLPLASAGARAPQPQVISRAEWGANESLRRGTTTYSDELKVAFVHHVVSSNNYTEAQAAQQMRNVYSWFTQGVGVNDFGYNFVVDRFGNIYEGRAGGIDRVVNGAHTQGFNSESFAVSFLGNADTLNPKNAEAERIVGAMADLIAWKFAIHHVDPTATSVLTSAGPGPIGQGTSMYWPGEKVSSPTIAGHGDIGNTSCPGTFLRPYVPKLRTMVSNRAGGTFYRPSIAGSGSGWGSGTPITATTRVTAAANLTMSIASACGDQVRTVQADSGSAGTLQLSWDGLNDRGKRVPPGRYNVTISGRVGGEKAYDWTGYVRISTSPGSPADPCSPPSEFTVAGTGYGHGVGLSQWGALGQAREGRDAQQILSHYYPGTQMQQVDEPTDLRIGLLHEAGFAQIRTETINNAGGGLEISIGNNVFAGAKGANYRLEPSDKYVRVTQSLGGEQTVLGRGLTVTVRWSGTADPGGAGSAPTLLNLIGPGESFASPRHRYRYGTVEVTGVSTSGGRRLAVVNVVDMESYLKGIAEVPANWPSAALQSQAIASRSYAMAKYRSGTRAACLCHMDDGGGPYYDQTFHAYDVESGTYGAQWVKAVRETRGDVVTYGGAPIPAFYTAATGGRTQASSDVWGGAGYPWSKSVDDRWSLTVDGNPYRTWSVTASQTRMAQIFGVSDIMLIEIQTAQRSGAAASLVATTYDGRRASVSGTTFRSALGLRSTYLTSVLGDQPATTPTDPTVPTEPTIEAKVSLVRRPLGKIVEGSTATLKGRVRASDGADLPSSIQVQRQVRWGSLAWANRERVGPDNAGRFSFALPDIGPAGTTYYWRVLVYQGSALIATSKELKGTIAADGSTQPDDPAVDEPTAPRTDIAVSLVRRPKGTISEGSTAILKGKVKRAGPDVVVQRQVSWDGVDWQERETTTPNTKGRYEFTMSDIAPAGRTYRWRVLVLDDGQIVATSPIRRGTIR